MNLGTRYVLDTDLTFQKPSTGYEFVDVRWKKEGISMIKVKLRHITSKIVVNLIKHKPLFLHIGEI